MAALDVARVAVDMAALLLLVTAVSLALQKWTRPHPHGSSVLGLLSYTVLLVIVMVGQIERIGEPALSWRLPALAVAVALGWAAALARVSVDWRPPWRRHHPRRRRQWR